jgi:hypothetical protein
LARRIIALVAKYPPYDPNAAPKRHKLPLRYVIQNIFMAILAVAALGYGAYSLMGVQPDLGKDPLKIRDSKLTPGEYFDNVHPGMTKPDVKAAIGEPERIVEAETEPVTPERWFYNRGKLEIHFQNGFLSEKFSH